MPINHSYWSFMFTNLAAPPAKKTRAPMVFNCDCMFFKSKNKANLYQIKHFTLFKNAVFFIQIRFTKIQKNSSTKDTPLQALAFAVKNWN